LPEMRIHAYQLEYDPQSLDLTVCAGRSVTFVQTVRGPDPGVPYSVCLAVEGPLPPGIAIAASPNPLPFGASDQARIQERSWLITISAEPDVHAATHRLPLIRARPTAESGVSDNPDAGTLVTLHVQAAGAEDATFTTTVNTPLHVPAPGPLRGVAERLGRPAVAVLVTPPTHGALMLQGDGAFLYMPKARYTGPDSFRYKLDKDAPDSTAATVWLLVSPAAPAQPPRAADHNQPPPSNSAVGTAQSDSTAAVRSSARGDRRGGGQDGSG